MQLFRRWSRSDSGVSRTEVEFLERQVTMLRARLNHIKGWLAAAVAVVFLLVGLVLVVDEKPLKWAIIDWIVAFGVLRQTSEIDAAYAAYDKGRYAEALRLSRPLAQQGDPRAQSLLAEIYYHGRGASQDDLEAIKWFRRAADQGDVVAQFHLGDAYSAGRGVPQDYTEAAKWYRMAADQKNAKAQFNLGFLFSNGQGVPHNNVFAHMWFNLAAANYLSAESRNRAAMNRDRIAEKMSSGEVAEAQRLAREWTANEGAFIAP